MAANKTKPKGSRPDKIMRDALSIELHTELKVPVPGKPNQFIRQKKFRLVQRALVNEAIKGDVQAIKEINDRMDGKVPNVVAGTGRDGAIPIDLRQLTDDQLETLIARLAALAE